jgi:hypothetical protein
LLPGNGEQDRKREDGVDGDDDSEKLGLYASIAAGYITGFWIVCGSLVLKRSWRRAYFNFVYNMRVKLLVLMAVNLERLKRGFGLERNWCHSIYIIIFSASKAFLLFELCSRSLLLYFACVNCLISCVVYVDGLVTLW